MMGWLRFFRVVNLPTVPGDVLVGAAAAGCGNVRLLVGASVVSCLLYLFGLADNDIVGWTKDGPERPIPAGEISLVSARSARALCLFGALIVGAAVGLPSIAFLTAFVLACLIVLYNRTKLSVAMGLCRGLNVFLGGALLIPAISPQGFAVLLVSSLVWTVYITFVTLYSSGESEDPAKRQRVGFLVGAVVYLQLGALLLFYQLAPSIETRNFLLVGAALLVVLRLLKRFLPKVSAS